MIRSGSRADLTEVSLGFDPPADAMPTVTITDACFRPADNLQGFCTVLCTKDEDCPEGPKGELAVCKSVNFAGIKAAPFLDQPPRSNLAGHGARPEATHQGHQDCRPRRR